MTTETPRPDGGVEAGFAIISPAEAACIAGGARIWRPSGYTPDGQIIWEWVNE